MSTGSGIYEAGTNTYTFESDYSEVYVIYASSDNAGSRYGSCACTSGTVERIQERTANRNSYYSNFAIYKITDFVKGSVLTISNGGLGYAYNYSILTSI